MEKKQNMLTFWKYFTKLFILNVLSKLKKLVNYKNPKIIDMNLDQTKELDELIFKKMNGEKTKYVDFLEIFYKIIYIKCAQQVEKTV